MSRANAYKVPNEDVFHNAASNFSINVNHGYSRGNQLEQVAKNEKLRRTKKQPENINYGNNMRKMFNAAANRRNNRTRAQRIGNFLRGRGTENSLVRPNELPGKSRLNRFRNYIGQTASAKPEAANRRNNRTRAQRVGNFLRGRGTRVAPVNSLVRPNELPGKSRLNRFRNYIGSSKMLNAGSKFASGATSIARGLGAAYQKEITGKSRMNHMNNYRKAVEKKARNNAAPIQWRNNPLSAETYNPFEAVHARANEALKAARALSGTPPPINNSQSGELQSIISIKPSPPNEVPSYMKPGLGVLSPNELQATQKLNELKARIERLRKPNNNQAAPTPNELQAAHNRANAIRTPSENRRTASMRGTIRKVLYYSDLLSNLIILYYKYADGNYNNGGLLNQVQITGYRQRTLNKVIKKLGTANHGEVTETIAQVIDDITDAGLKEPVIARTDQILRAKMMSRTVR